MTLFSICSVNYCWGAFKIVAVLLGLMLFFFSGGMQSFMTQCCQTNENKAEVKEEKVNVPFIKTATKVI